MEKTKLFKNIWRFNALIIASAGLLAIVVLLFAAYMFYEDMNRNRHQNRIVNVDPETNIKEVFRLGRLQRIVGTQSVIIPLNAKQKYSISYSSGKSASSVRNILFSNMHAETSKWLLPNNQFLIANHRLLNEENSYGDGYNIVTILYDVVKSDTNNDSRLTTNDKLTIALSDPEGNNYTEVLDNVDEVLGYDVLNKQALAIVFNRGDQGYIAYVNLADFKIEKEVELPKSN